MELHPTVLEACGKPAFVVLPYKEYLHLVGSNLHPSPRIPADGTIPNEVVQLMVGSSCSIIRAWREHLGITQSEMANRLGIRQPTYVGMEASGARPRKSTRQRIATAMGLHPDQLDV
ncbi:transcriptional regulator [Bordetella genomosp. 8]|uniref:Transcriptional regulator n=1 Tax=Bordetella genomosp. 8 TaxID=1416806 RepID=A0A1W6YQ14_9BORD|nr:helix-turn-helix transcriptional regulator [Bordetella genomosp. 8]ARP83196.1 transcriptional regulator [Bordetella genomosp. 8]